MLVFAACKLGPAEENLRIVFSALEGCHLDCLFKLSQRIPFFIQSTEMAVRFGIIRLDFEGIAKACNGLVHQAFVLRCNA